MHITFETKVYTLASVAASYSSLDELSIFAKKENKQFITSYLNKMVL